MMDSQEGRAAMEDTNGVFGTLKTMSKLAEEGKRINRKLLVETWDSVKDINPDVVIFHPKGLAGAHIAEKCGAQAILAVMQPMIVPTTATPPIGIPPLKLGGWYNKMTYSLITMGYSAYKGMVNTFRTETLGLEKLPRSSTILMKSDGEPTPVMHAFSSQIMPEPKDWPDYATMTGYWFLDASTDWQPPADLVDFLEAGDPPVYVGFGSMAGRDPEGLTKKVIGALQKANVRGLIATGWGGLSTADLPENIFKIESAPHSWLFDRVSAVVHHGGAGTTAAGLRAGRPTVICSFFGDQPFWGEQVYKMGVGPKHIPQKKLTDENLAAAIIEATGNDTMRQKAKAVGEKIRNEDGIASAVRFIEKTARK